MTFAQLVLYGVVVAAWGVLPVYADFYVCPDGCQAMLLPRDMEMIDDCLCNDGVDTTKEEQAADAQDNGKFVCQGRNKPKHGVRSPQSAQDCDCYHPYEKNAASQECVLTSCPRAGNYEPKPGVADVTSLADCNCMAPYVKAETSGQCLMNGDKRTVAGSYQCPPHATPTDDVPKSFADCHCDWGFVRNHMDQCERERTAYVCPVNSVKRADLPIDERPRGFFDCECLANGNYRRDEELHACWPVVQQQKRVPKRKHNGEVVDEYELLDVIDRDIYPFQCPPFSRAVAAVPHSIEQCQCLLGYSWKLPEMTCVRTSAYRCPDHAYKRTKIEGIDVETSFDDCACARGYFLDAVAQRCVPWMLANSNQCPPFAVLTRWPLQSNANCECVYGLNETDTYLETEALRRQGDNSPVKKSKKTCNTKPIGVAENSARGAFSQCPRDSFATTWPVASPDDCSCLSGFEMAPLSEEEVAHGVGDGFRCVASSENNLKANEAAAACRAPHVIHPLSGECRLPMEEIPAKRASFKKPQPLEGVMFRGIEYDYDIVDDNVMVIQGDVAIGERFNWEERHPDEEQGEGNNRIEHVLHGYYNSGRDHRWPRSEMCFQIDRTARVLAHTILSAAEHITHATGFKLHRCEGDNCRTDMNCRSHDFVVVQSTESSCYSFVGRIGGPQRLGVSADCGLGNMVHVFLHAIGLRHAVDRPDRDEHVRIAWECIPESKRSYFVVEDTNVASESKRPADRVLEPPPYDLFSIMHHPADAFVHSVPDDDQPEWCPSIVPLVASDDARLAIMREMGQRERMTSSDVESVWALYPGLKKRHHQHQKAGETGEAEVEDLHESFVHTQDDAVQTESAAGHGAAHRGFGQRFISFLGAVAMLVGFGALLAFATTELRRRALLGSEDFFYEAPLIDSKNDI